MRPRISSACWSACSWVIFSFLTSPPSWPFVTCSAFCRPWSTNFCSTSFSTTSTPAAAQTWAISPPIVPAPTTAALNTNMNPPKWRRKRRYRLSGRVRQSRVLRRLDREGVQRAPDRVAQRAADEDHVGHLHQRPAGVQLVVELDQHARAVALLVGLERDGLAAGQLVVEHVDHEARGRLDRDDLLGHDAAAAGLRVPDHGGARLGPALVPAVDRAEAVDERGPAAGVGPQVDRLARRQDGDRAVAGHAHQLPLP